MVDVRRFRAACHEAARRTGGTVTEFRLAHGVTPNFHQGLIAYHDRAVAIACLRETPLLAVAEPRDFTFATSRDTGPLTFVDAPALVAALRALPEFRVLTYTDICRPFDAAAWLTIDPDDLKYWNPTTVGEALFNYWD